MASKHEFRHTFAVVVLLLTIGGVACAPETVTAMQESLQTAAVRFEQNATDGDVEVVFDVTIGDHGATELMIVGPDGRTVANFRAPDASTMGIRTFQFESPEPSDIPALKAAYPAGTYVFTGRTATGMTLTGRADLNHNLPGTASFVHPAEEAEDVALDGLLLTWSAVPGVAHYIIELENDELDVTLSVRLPGTTTTFAPPVGFLLPDTEYTMSIGTVSPDENISFVETSFTTAR